MYPDRRSLRPGPASAVICVGFAVVAVVVVNLYAQDESARPRIRRPTAGLPPATAPAHGLMTATRPSQAPVEKAKNPHWNRNDCFVCHERTPEGRAAPIPLTEVNDLCLTCHDGRRAHKEAHPVGRTFATEGVINPGWPAPEGPLSCVTCHNFGPGHSRGGPRPEVNAWMLRDYTGGRLGPWCAKCHVASPAHQPFNPHVMLDEHGEVNWRNCVLCHEVTEGFDRQVRLGRPELIAEELSLCARCHTRHVDWFTPGHMGMPVPARMRAYMLAREDAGMEGRLSSEQIEPHLGSARRPARLPLGEGDRVVCSTCHNPHQAGLFPPQMDLGMGAISPRATDHEPLKTRGLGRGICRGCHNQ